MNECSMRGFKTDTKWLDVNYRGKNCLPFPKHEINNTIYCEHFKGELASELDYYSTKFIYPEHNPKYLLECLDNLQSKNAELINNISVAELKLKLEIAGV
jgi:hypothetical protein